MIFESVPERMYANNGIRNKVVGKRSTVRSGKGNSSYNDNSLISRGVKRVWTLGSGRSPRLHQLFIREQAALRLMSPVRPAGLMQVPNVGRARNAGEISPRINADLPVTQVLLIFNVSSSCVTFRRNPITSSLKNFRDPFSDSFTSLKKIFEIPRTVPVLPRGFRELRNEFR